MTYALWASLLLNVLFVLFWMFTWIKDPVPPMPTDRLLFLRRKLEKFRSLERDETWELFRALSKYAKGE